MRTRYKMPLLAMVLVGACSAAPTSTDGSTVPSPPTDAATIVPATEIAATTQPTAPPTTVPVAVTFGDGTLIVGVDIPPGRYVASDVTGCAWGVGELSDVTMNNFLEMGQVVVDISPSDAAFQSYGCGGWVVLIESTPVTEFGAGYWVVGSQIAPGRWQSASIESDIGCFWRRLKGFGDAASDTIESGQGYGSITVEIAEGDVGFFSDLCADWTTVG